MAVSVPFGDPETHGTFCDSLTFSRFRGKTSLTKKPKQKQNYVPTSKQTNNRKAMSLLAFKWNSESPLWKGKWKTYGETINLQGYIAYSGRGIDAYIDQIGSDTEPATVKVVGVPPNETWFWT